MAKVTDVLGRPFSGLVPYAVVGVVEDNVDPDELGRIQVKFPTLHEEPLSFWLRQVSPNAGAERGLYALPEKQDEVLVLFMQGSQDVGVIIGQFWNGVDKPPTEAKDGLPGASATDTGGSWSTEKFSDGSTSLDDNDRRFWRSRSGHLLVFDDTSGSETVQLWDNSHKLSLVFDTAAGLITLANNNGDLHIRTKGTLFLEAGQDIKYYAGMNVNFEAGQNIEGKSGMDYKIEAGMNEEHKAGMDLKLEGGMNLSGKASMNCSLEGSMMFEAKGGIQAKVEGSAMGVLKGGIVMIN
jgi:uncharacterized protein involved in type VI secretion and phage assembly